MKTSFKAKILVSGLAGMSLLAAPSAEALTTTVDVDGTNYDVTYTNSDITYNGNESLFNTLANGGEMPWWGSSILAQQFATIVGSSLGYPNDDIEGPYFAYNGNVSSWYSIGSSIEQENGLNPLAFRYYATATLHVSPPTAVPAPLPFLGVAAAFGMSRRLRQRLRSAP